jgi:hypothetical protein
VNPDGAVRFLLGSNGGVAAERACGARPRRQKPSPDAGSRAVGERRLSQEGELDVLPAFGASAVQAAEPRGAGSTIALISFAGVRSGWCFESGFLAVAG